MYVKSEVEKRVDNQSLAGGMRDATGPAPNEAWVKSSTMKFQIYVRGVVQFCLLASSGLEDQLAPLRQANIQTIRIKYKRLRSDASWTSSFLPSECLDLACSAEIRHWVLTIEASYEFMQMTKRMNEMNPMIQQSLGDTVGCEDAWASNHSVRHKFIRLVRGQKAT